MYDSERDTDFEEEIMQLPEVASLEEGQSHTGTLHGIQYKATKQPGGYELKY